MSAAQHKGVDALVDQRTDILHHDLVRDRALKPALFDQWHEKGTSARSHPNVRVERAQARS